MTDSYPSGEPRRPLPPYRPAGPQAGPAPQAVYAPIPSQGGAPSAPLHAVPAPVPAYATAPAHAQGAGPVPAQGAGPVHAQGAWGSMTPGVPTSAPPAPPEGLPPYVPPTAVPAGQVPPPAHTSVPVPASMRVAAPPPGAPAPQTRAAGRAAARAGVGQDRREDDIDVDQVLRELVRLGGSDAHLTTGSVPMARVSGSLKALDGFAVVEGDALRRSLYAILSQKQRERFEEHLELDLSYSVRNLARFRVNLYQQREAIGAAFRVIPYEIKPLEELGVPPVVGSFANLPRGLVLVTGPTGSGKSTTLAAVIDLANRTREDHIMTVEDPIEFLHNHKKCLVNQREIGQDTHSFANALKHVLRQDPDIILVGEMRDLETISVALTAAETGHLVFATLHTQDAAQTIDRIIDVFPPSQQAQVRTQLAGALQGVVSQTLCKRADSPGRAVATEVLVATPGIRNLIREGKTHQIYSAMQAGAQQGMHTLDQHLAELVKSGRVSYEVGLEKCHHVEDYNRLTGRSGSAPQGGAGGYGGPGY